MKHNLKNLLLGYPSDWFVDPVVLKTVKNSMSALNEFWQKQGDCEAYKTEISTLVSEPVKEVYTVPFFSEKFCAILKDEIQNIKEKNFFQVNDDEDALRQIPEFVLQDECPELFNSIFSVINSVMNPILLELWGRMVTSGGIQIANYSPKEKKKGAWHHDESSDITIVVPLNTGEYEGGGTEFYNRGTVPPLPSGSALIFPALTHLHRGLSVLSGERYLLVFWLKCGEKNEN